MIEPSLMASGSDVVIGLVIAIPVLLVGGGVAVGMRFRGRGRKSAVPPGEVASDAPTDIELARSAERDQGGSGGGPDRGHRHRPNRPGAHPRPGAGGGP